MEAPEPAVFGQRFLTAPDLFPGRRSGEPWGERGLRLDLPGGPYLVRGLSVLQAAAARERFGEACRLEGRQEAAAPADVLLFRAPPGDFRQVDTRGWDYSLDFDYGPRAVRLAGLRLMARLDWPDTLAPPGLPRGPVAALWAPEEGAHFPGIFENLLRVLVAYRLVAAGGVLLHAAGVADGRGAFLFLGASGAGKSTLSRLSAQAGKSVLSDDLNAVVPGPGSPDTSGGAVPEAPVPRPEAERSRPTSVPGEAAAGAGREVSAAGGRGDLPRVERVPFTGDFASAGAPGSYPLRAVLRLEKAAVDRLSPLGAAETVATLLACSPFVNADPHRRERLVANLVDLAGRTPGGVLAFSLAGGFWRILDANFP